MNPAKPQPLTAEQAKTLITLAMKELGHDPSLAEKIKMATLINNLYEDHDVVLVVWPR